MDKRVDKEFKELCEKGCGRKFSPAGRAYHEKFCTGKGYKPGRTHSVPGGHGAKGDRTKIAKAMISQVTIPCRKGCGRECLPQGRPHHERFCTGPGYLPGYSAQRRIERRISPKPDLNMRARQEAPTYIATYAPKAGVEIIFEMFKDDAAFFSIICHLMSARAGLDVMNNLDAAKAMIDLKKKMLEA